VDFPGRRVQITWLRGVAAAAFSFTLLLQQTTWLGAGLTTLAGALATIERLGPITLGELAAVEQVQPPSMTRIVGRLEEWGYATRVVDPADRRVARAVITDAGRELLARSRTRKDEYLARRIAELSDTERALLARALPLIERLQDEAL